MGTQKQYDVLVVGGGVAGVAAALQSDRCGLRTALIEKTVLWGGLATGGLVPIYVPLCNGKGRQVTFGIAEELLFASLKYGPGQVPARWAKGAAGPQENVDQLYPEATLSERYMAVFSPVCFALGLDEVLENSGVELWLDTLGCLPLLEGSRVAGVEVENKSGRITLRARCVVDSTGDADIAFRAGAPCVEHGSSPSFLYQYSSQALATEAVERQSARRLVTHKGAGVNESHDDVPRPGKRYSGTSGKEVSEFLMKSRKGAREALAGEQARIGRENIYPAALPHMPQIRMSRRIAGQETIGPADVNKKCQTSVGMVADCRKTDAIWEVPYGSLLPQNVDNLLAAGRCTAADGYAWQVTRLIPAVALTGQIAGLAAALAVKANTSPARLEAKDVQKAAEARNIVLHL
jgi:succinate dehydrogenase/fumarate reductase flavoprotein subunit